MSNNNEFRKYAVHHLGMSGNGLDSYMKYINENPYTINAMTPNIVEERQLRATVLDVFSRLMADRIIFFGTPVDDYVANVITAQLLFLESADHKKDIIMYVNSPGGSVYAGLGIYDTMQYVSPDVATICTGLAASMGAVLLAAGANKKRSALPHARIMIHQPLSGMQGQASDMEISLRQTLEVKRDLYNILSKHSGQKYEKIEKDSDRDYWMRAAEAKEYGLIDDVLERKKS
ncbi:ATP-dependent Clp protease proteolytic subunit [Pseudochryseolinea flava]|uniref:ATP-dependent Clp protease proteolytic subunit n=1 Tax=Pseudochryseolinea flava TaxID=2059302 RepID=A0A364Y1F7_9BACT|nr:ATP-dependent Clp protease proteolytic subunit [Pseudochryseolinea flava]RAV99916.1 ATP-dependent Clp protease proteolytic subunit [Pseudochryseolinea flava]